MPQLIEAVKPFPSWPLWQRALLINASATIGVYFGFVSSSAKVSPAAQGYIVVFCVVLLNLMLLSAAPRLYAARAEGKSPNPYSVLYQVLAERPFLTTLFALQLVRVAQALGASMIFFRGPNSEYFRGTANIQSIAPYVYATGWFMASIAALWLLSAIGIWLARTWGWWLALLLNASGIALQLPNLHKLSVDPLSVVVTALLFLPQVRAAFSRGATAVNAA